MFDTATARRHMVDGQIRTADVTNPNLIAAMQAVPREQFGYACVTGNGKTCLKDPLAIQDPKRPVFTEPGVHCDSATTVY